MRRWIAVIGAVGAVACVMSLPASAFGAATCTDLQTSLNNASPGATINIDQVYTNCSLTISSAHSPITLQGTVAGAGFDGTSGLSASIITGSSIGATVFRDLTFKNAHTTSNLGSAIHIDGASSPQFINDVFLNNTTTNGSGGALYANVNGSAPLVISGSTFGGLAAGLGNSAASGGAVEIVTSSQDVQVTGSSFLGNRATGGGGGANISVNPGMLTIDSTTFEGNTAKVLGGGAFAFGTPVILHGSTFRDNSLNDPASGPSGHAGAGLFTGSGVTGTIDQAGNVFDGNSLTYAQTSPGSTPSGGGGEYIAFGAATITGDRFVNNSVTNTSTEPGEGGGLHDDGCAASPSAVTPLTLVNVVVAGNSMYAGGEGAGVYAGCIPAGVHLQLTDSTVAGNAGAAALDGGSDDIATLTNSIVSGGPGQAAFSGFAPGGITGTFSDACLGGGPLAGAGNICADPALGAPGPGIADVHETAASPTIDTGSTPLVPPGLTTDFEGQPRVQGASVDMGADERPPVASPPLDTTPPSIGGLSASRRVFRVGRAPTPVSAVRHKAGTTIRYTLSEAATVTFTFRRLLPGRRVHGRCRRRARVGKRCTLAVKAGTLTRKAAAGKNSLKFSGRIGRRKLKLGRYRLTLTARDAAGNLSKPSSLGLRIVSR